VRYSVFFLLIVFSCNPPSLDRESQRIVKEELDSRRIIRASDGEIIAKAQEIGKEVTEASQNALSSALMEALKEKGLMGAIQYCNIQAMPIVDSLSQQYNARIGRTSLKTRNRANEPTSLEEQILEAYQHAHDNNQALNDNVQLLSNEEILYTKPIVIGNAMCLNCHGTPGNELLAENYEELKKLYPNDEAIGYSVGDFRGIWSIRFNKKEILKNM
jgi:hypothetical protein